MKKIITDNNEIIDASVSIEIVNELKGIVFHSRGGSKKSENVRNTDYALGLEIILSRLKNKNVNLINIYINSSEWKNILPDIKDRKLKVDNKFDVDLQNYDIKTLRKEIGKVVAEKKINKETKGGNSTKNIILTTPNNKTINWDEIIRPSNIIIADDLELKINKSEFNISNSKDAVEKTLVNITKRKGQTKFRKELLESYNYKCAVTGTDTIQVLQAAHIIPYNGESTNELSNGIILRSDIHDLFDLNLIGITSEYKIVIGSELRDSIYEQYNGKKIYIPAKENLKPSKEALKSRPIPKR